MMMNFDMRERCVQRPGARAGVRLAAIGLLIAAASLASMSPVGAMPLVTVMPPTFDRPAIFTDVLTTCDTRGCFTFGPRQSYHRPNYRPLGQTGPRYYSPRAAGPPRFLYRPQAPAPLPQARLPAADPSFHRQSCMNRYRSYNPLTDSYIGSGRKPVRCILPQRR